MDWETVSYVFSSELRLKTLIELSKSIYTPKQLSALTNQPMSHVSKTLKELRIKGLVKCLTPNRKKAKLYSITKLGNQVIDEINKLTHRDRR